MKHLTANEKDFLTTLFKDKINDINSVSYAKLTRIIEQLPAICDLSESSLINRQLRQQDKDKYHPIRPSRGMIYNAFIEENVGSELCDNHLVIIMQNTNGNIFGEKVNVLPIEGDGKRINKNYQMELKNEELEYGQLDKNPSRIIITDLITIDKARLDKVEIGKIKPAKLLELSNKLKRQLVL